MKTLKLISDNAELIASVPSDWNELSSVQIVYLIRMVENKVTAEEVKLKMLLYCIDAHIRKYDNKKSNNTLYLLKVSKKEFWLTAEELASIAAVFNFLFKEKDGEISINPLLTINPFPSTQCGCITVYGPAEGLTDITYQQFSDLMIWSTRIGESDMYLNKFISIIYKRKTAAATPELIAKMSPTVKTAILWFYYGCLQLIQAKFPLVFSGDGSSGDIVDGQMRTIDALAEGKLADKEKVKSALLYDALYTIQCAIEKANKVKQ